MSPRALWISVLCLLLYGTAWGKLWNAESFPNPNVEPDRCGRSGRKSSSICDPDSMISSTVRDTVDGIVNNLHEGKRGFKLGPCGSGYDGYQVGVALMRSADVKSGDRDLEFGRLARAILDKWGVGSQACNNGVLFLVSFEDRYMYIATGKGAAERLTNSRIDSIVGSTRKLLRQKDDDKAILFAVQSIAESLSKEPTWVDSLWQFASNLFFFAIVGGGFLFTGMLMVQSWKKSRRVKDVRGKLKKIQDERDKSRDVPNFSSPSCPICLEDFTEEPQVERLKKQSLRCGHTFHSGCIEDWLRTSARQTCPICQQNAFGDSPTERKDGSQGQNGDSTVAGAYPVHFRLRRLHYLYPDVVAQTHVDGWLRDPYCDFVGVSRINTLIDTSIETRSGN
uniref:RING-type domain-containing protein n=2 Tax=Rhodosorus marinus TaxID=101924 RepID=A0A7S2ZJ90_9RHOD|mmetsp:Transcript_21377/g.87322  ORF Transcript_21377/g.87322 Transcript_21377/m.87322 type:complete len:394 (+) Transcript_21377:231-1412(+)